MKMQRQQFTDEVVDAIHHILKIVFNAKSQQDIQNVVGMNNNQMTAVVNQLSDKLPEKVFNQPQQKLEELKNICAREFVFFQVQEKPTQADYQRDLANFITIFCRDIAGNQP